MDLSIIDKEYLKSAIRDVLREEPGLLKSVLLEIIKEEESKLANSNRKTLIQGLIKDDFERYEKVFKAVA